MTYLRNQLITEILLTKTAASLTFVKYISARAHAHTHMHTQIIEGPPL